jgi:hypothetical protein
MVQWTRQVVTLIVGALAAAGALAEYGGAAMECTEAHYAQLGATGSDLHGDTPLSEWAWMGRDMPYNPVLVERFRKMAHLESPTYHCTVRATAADAACCCSCTPTRGLTRAQRGMPESALWSSGSWRSTPCRDAGPYASTPGFPIPSTCIRWCARSLAVLC